MRFGTAGEAYGTLTLRVDHLDYLYGMKALICFGSLMIGGVFATSTTTDDIVWETSFAAAKERAAKENKGIFHLQLFGRLDEELC